MAAKKNVTVTPAFTGRNVSLSEISQASGIGIATLKRGLLPELLTSVMRSPVVKAISIAITAPTGLCISRPDISIRTLRSRTQIPKPLESLYTTCFTAFTANLKRLSWIYSVTGSTKIHLTPCFLLLMSFRRNITTGSMSYYGEE